MAMLSFAHVEQMLEDTFPRHSRKALALLSFITGLVLGTALLSLVAAPAIQTQPAVSLAQLNMQPARAQQSMPQPKARHFMQPVVASVPDPPALMGRREFAASFAGLFAAAAALPAQAVVSTKNYNSVKGKNGEPGDKPTKWGLENGVTSNGRRGIYGDVKIPSVGDNFPAPGTALNPKDMTNKYAGPPDLGLTKNDYESFKQGLGVTKYTEMLKRPNVPGR
jgi:hypothetical protein